MRVEPGHREACQHRPPPRARRLAVGVQAGAGSEHPPGGEGAVAQQERAADEPDRPNGARPGHHHRADPADTQRDEQRVGQGADPDHGEDGVPAHPLAQDEGVLGADGDDQGEPGAESGGRGGQSVVHAPTLGKGSVQVQLKILTYP